MPHPRWISSYCNAELFLPKWLKRFSVLRKATWRIIQMPKYKINLSFSNFVLLFDVIFKLLKIQNNYRNYDGWLLKDFFSTGAQLKPLTCIRWLPSTGIDTGFFSDPSESVKVKIKITVTYEKSNYYKNHKIISFRRDLWRWSDPNCSSEEVKLGQVA